MKLRKEGIDETSNEYLSSFRSFEGEAFENMMYEKLLRYAKDNDYIKYFIVKGPHNRSKALPKTLSVNSKGQIVYRTKNNEIGEFDALFVTVNDELFFVEMTLVKSITNLKRRLRKKRALLKTIFPQYEIKALIILNEGVLGSHLFQDFCTVWVTKAYDSSTLLKRLRTHDKRLPFEPIKGEKFVDTKALHIKPFHYYNVLGWIYRQSRAHKYHVLDMAFLNRNDVVRYTELFTKIYIGYVSIEDFKSYCAYTKETKQTKVVVSLEKEHTGALLLQFFILHSRKKLDLVQIRNDQMKVTQKDPYGISISEVIHTMRVMDECAPFDKEALYKIEALLEKNNQKYGKMST